MGLLIVVFGIQMTVYGREETWQIYQDHKLEILNKKGVVCYYAGYLFVSCSQRITVKEEIAYRKAELGAKKTFLEYAVRQISWPEGFSETLRQRLGASFVNLADCRILLRHAEVVERKKLSTKKVCVVVGVPRKGVLGPDVVYKDVKRKLTNAWNSGKDGLDVGAFLEICNRSEIPAVLRKYGESVRDNGLCRVIKGEYLINKAEIKLPEDNENVSSNGTSLEFLSHRLQTYPYLPRACYRLGQTFKKIGFPRNAQLFYQRGTVWHISPKYNKRCRKKLQTKLFTSDRQRTWQALLSRVEKLFREEIPELPKFLEKKRGSRLIVACFGSVPVKNQPPRSKSFNQGNSFFYSSPPQVNKALEKYLDALEEDISADTCNMIGACLRELDSPKLALPFFAQAARMEPEHKYALVNLALVSWSLGARDVAREIAGKVKKKISLDKWGEDQINSILK